MMTSFEIKIKPLTGFNQVKFGMNQETISGLIGAPNAKFRRPLDKHEEEKIIWRYLNLDIDLLFYSDEKFLLGAITVRSKCAILFGEVFIGRNELYFLTKFKELKMGSLSIFYESKSLQKKTYLCDELGLFFHLDHGEIKDIFCIPMYDKTGEIPLWPK